jgi:signal transduction histidine kinase/DNA-binding response OmpR family regulator
LEDPCEVTYITQARELGRYLSDEDIALAYDNNYIFQGYDSLSDFFSQLKRGDLFNGLLIKQNELRDGEDSEPFSYYQVAVIPVYLANEPISFVLLGRSITSIMEAMELAIAADVKLIDPEPYEFVTVEYLEGEELEFYDTIKPFLDDKEAYRVIDEKRGLDMTAVSLIPKIEFNINGIAFNDVSYAGESPYRLIVERNISATLQRQSEITSAFLPLGAGIMGLLLILLGYVQRQSFQPLKEAVEVLNLMAQGERNVEMPKQSGLLSSDTDEVGQLINALESYQKESKELERVKRLTEELEVARDEASEANAAKSKFLANMSHELRTPLNGILGYADLLLEEAEDDGNDRMAADLTKISHSGKHLLSLINDILDLSKIEAGRMELYLTDFRVSDLMEQTKTISQTLADKNGNSLVFEYADDEDDNKHIRGDETRLRQCVVNLISNAVKFTENGTVTITSTPYDKDDAKWLSIAVTDTGIGMTEEQLGTILQEYAQADNSTAANYGGTGLGLTITTSLIQMMGGYLDVESEYGKGTTFTINVPRYIQEAANEEAYSDITGDSGPLVLIVDDDTSTQDLIRRMLKTQNFRMAGALKGASGLELAKSLKPDVILLDIYLPDQDGWKVLEQLKSDPELADTPVFIISVTEAEKEADLSGVQKFLHKPIDRETFLDAIRELGIALEETTRVLIVDDDADAREIIGRVLSAQGADYVEAKNGAEALNMVNDGFSMIVLDLDMPVMNGFEFMRSIDGLDTLKNIPIIVFSGMELDSEQSETVNRYTAGIINKTDLDHEDRLTELLSDLMTVKPAS